MYKYHAFLVGSIIVMNPLIIEHTCMPHYMRTVVCVIVNAHTSISCACKCVMYHIVCIYVNVQSHDKPFIDRQFSDNAQVFKCSFAALLTIFHRNFNTVDISLCFNSIISNHQPQHCLLNRLLRRRPKKTSKLRVTGLCAGNSQVIGEFPKQMASNAENVSI